MVESSEAPAGHHGMDYAEHEATYALFLTLLKYLFGGVVVVILFLAFMWG